MLENWRDVPGYEGRYMVSDQGRVRSLITNRLLSLCLTGKEQYARVSLTRKSDGVKVRLVHHLVLLTFKGPRTRGFQIRHLNGVPTDNRLNNLVYGTKAENEADKAYHGSVKGERNPNHRLTAEDIIFIRSQFYSRGLYMKLARRFNVSSRMISYIFKDEAWKHLN